MSFLSLFGFCQFAIKKAMTELYIDRQLVVLPETFSITIIEENPFFTKNGKYTYDITLSLLNPINARIYNHLNRINRKGDIPQNRSAYMIVDNEVVLNGTEVILEHGDSEVKIQLVSGNSELNFVIGGDRKVRDLDLGKAEKYVGKSVDVATAIYYDLRKKYPQRDWQLVPFAYGYAEYTGEEIFNIQGIGNYYRIPPVFENSEIQVNPSIAQPFFSGAFSGQVPQPYLCFIIERILSYLGYKLIKNSIAEHTRLSQIYIVHGYNTLEFAKMLPDWTVTEFFENIEKWLDCVFLIDKYTREVRLIFEYQYEEIENKMQELTVLDEFSVEIDSENRMLNKTSNIAYSLDTDDYYTFACLNEKAREIAKYKSFPDLRALQTWFKQNKDISVFGFIFRVTDTGDEFIAYDTGKKRVLKKVDAFKPLMNNKNSDKIDISLDIIPASMMYSVIYTMIPFSLFPRWSSFWVQVPVAGETAVSVSAEESGDTVVASINIQDTIENNAGKEDTASTKMRVAVFNGIRFLPLIEIRDLSKIGDAVYPSASVESLTEYFQETQEEDYYGNKGQNILRLEYLNNEIYSKADIYDTTKIVKLTFIDYKNIHVTSKFVANNRMYRCVKVERVVTQQGFEAIAKGEFYPYS